MVATVLLLVAFVLVLVDEFRAKGQSLTGWAVAFICVALLIGRVSL